MEAALGRSGGSRESIKYAKKSAADTPLENCTLEQELDAIMCGEARWQGCMLWKEQKKGANFKRDIFCMDLL